MKTIAHFHSFIDTLHEGIREELISLSTERSVVADEFIYRQGQDARELYQLIEGSVRICNYTLDGKEAAAGSFRPGDCFGEMGLIDGLPRVTYCIADQDTLLRVLHKRDFDYLYRKYPEISQEINRMLCRRIRLLIGMNEDAISLGLYERLGRSLQRLAYSHGHRDDSGQLTIDISHEELGKMLGASRQSVSKELKILEADGSVKVAYGKIVICDLESLTARFENLLGMEQLGPDYEETDGGEV
jgi:CRP/FNR family cyclic AMP-dependent transcriptional regulator